MNRVQTMIRAASGILLLMIGEAKADSDITFNTNFEGGSLGKIETLGDARFRCSVQGQYDEHGRNRQANWYYFRLDGAKGQDVALTLTDLVGEYDGKPGACPMTPDTIPVFSEDDLHWSHFATMDWDDKMKEATLKFRPTTDRIWIAHVPPYTHQRLLRLLDELDRSPFARIEVIGKTAQGRDLHLITRRQLREARHHQENSLAHGPAARLGNGHLVCHGGSPAIHHLRRCGGAGVEGCAELQVHADDGPGRLRDRQGAVQRQWL